MLTFDLREVAFSRRGSYLAICRHGPGAGEIFLRTIRGGVAVRQVFAVRLLRDGKEVAFRETATPDAVTLQGEGVRAAIVMENPRRFRFRVEGGGMRLAVPEVKSGWKSTYALPNADGRWQVNASPQLCRFMLVPLRGRLAVDAPWSRSRPDRVTADFLPAAGESTAEGAVDEWFSTWTPSPEVPFDAARRRVADEFKAWVDAALPAPPGLSDARALCAYVNWSCLVEPSGHFRRPGMLMSKNWMTNLWSWDHCFNALAAVAHDPGLAWDQFMAPFDHQDAHGAIPDSINDREIVWNWCKPPIHGWALLKLMEHPALADPARLNEAYGPLSAWTKWWLENRDSDRDGVIDYHHGNDSGWDNSTVFDDGCPVEGADLTAYLALQTEALAEVAGRLGRTGERAKWASLSEDLVRRLVDHCWRGDGFICPRSGDHAVAAGDSLIAFMPLILGRRLPESVRRRLVAGLTEPGRFLTEHGAATESVRSRFYEPNGYWRGPIWAPPTMFLVDGLADAGETDLARDLGGKFCRMVAKSGAAENFDAVTGAGLCDRAYTWTSSVFLLLASKVAGEKRAAGAGTSGVR